MPVQIAVLLSLGDVDISKPGCWEWNGVRTGSAQYGKYGGIYAHRIACEFREKPDNVDELLATHTCDNPPCVNPSHLRWGTATTNNRDTVIRNRRVLPNAHWTRITPWKKVTGDQHWTRQRPEDAKEHMKHAREFSPMNKPGRRIPNV